MGEQNSHATLDAIQPISSHPSTWFGPGRTLWLAPDPHPPTLLRHNYTNNM